MKVKIHVILFLHGTLSFSENSLHKLFRKHKIKIIRIDKINYMSGSLRVYAQKSNKNIKNIKKRVISLKKIIQFEKKMMVVKSKIIEFVYKMKKQNKIVAGVGAATKGNTLLNYCNLTSKHIDFILDKSPLHDFLA